MINKSEKNKNTLTYTKNVPGAPGIKLEDNTKKVNSIITNICKVITNNLWDKKTITSEIEKYFHLDENEKKLGRHM